MLHYENKVNLLKTEKAIISIMKKSWNFMLLSWSYGNTQVNVGGGLSNNNKNHHPLPLTKEGRCWRISSWQLLTWQFWALLSLINVTVALKTFWKASYLLLLILSLYFL